MLPLVASRRVLLLEGALAAGKTRFARALIQALLPHESVPSPSFSLLQSYTTPKGSLLHVDLYRLSSPEQGLELGLEEAARESFLMIEWPQRLGAFRKTMFAESTRMTLRLQRVPDSETRQAFLRIPERWITRELARLQSPRIPAAFVLAAGKGLRMRAYSKSLPKPLVAIGGRTVLARALDKLHAHGVERLFVNAHYRAEQIIAHCSRANMVRARVLYEPALLETGGALLRALPLFKHLPFFAVNGDALWYDEQHKQSLLSHVERAWQALALPSAILLALTAEPDGKDFCAHNRHPKRHPWSEGEPFPLTLPQQGEQAADFRCFRYMGVQILTQEAFRGAPSAAFSLRVLYRRAALQGNLYGMLWQGTWRHIGDKEALLRARRAFRKEERGESGEREARSE